MNTRAEFRPAIQLTGVTKKYNGTVALQDITLSLETGKIDGLLGRNGAGKTTLLSLLTTLRFPTSGDIRIFGENPAGIVASVLLPVNLGVSTWGRLFRWLSDNASVPDLSWKLLVLTILFWGLGWLVVRQTEAR